MLTTEAAWDAVAELLQQSKHELETNGWCDETMSKLAAAGYISADLLRSADRHSLLDAGIRPAYISKLLNGQGKTAADSPTPGGRALGAWMCCVINKW